MTRIVFIAVLSVWLTGCYQNRTLSDSRQRALQGIKDFERIEREAATYGLIAAGAVRVHQYSEPEIEAVRERLVRAIDSFVESATNETTVSPELRRINLELTQMLIKFKANLANGQDGGGNGNSKNLEVTETLQNELINAIQLITAAESEVSANPVDLARYRIDTLRYLLTHLESAMLAAQPHDEAYHRIVLSIQLTAFVRQKGATAAVVYFDLYPLDGDLWAHDFGKWLEQEQKKSATSTHKSSGKQQWREHVRKAEFTDEWEKFRNRIGHILHKDAKNPLPPADDKLADVFPFPVDDSIAIGHRTLARNGLVPRLVHVEALGAGELIDDVDARSSRTGLDADVTGPGGYGGSFSAARQRIGGTRGALINRLSIAFAAGNNRAGWYFRPSARDTGKGISMKPTERRIRMVIDVPRALKIMSIHVHKTFLDESLLPEKSASISRQLAAQNAARHILSALEDAKPGRGETEWKGESFMPGTLLPFCFDKRKGITAVDFRSSTYWKILKSRLRNSLDQYWDQELEVSLPTAIPGSASKWIDGKRWERVLRSFEDKTESKGKDKDKEKEGGDSQ